MKKLIASFCIAAIFSCNSSNEGYKKAENAQDAGTQFIRASLDGDYNKAAFYLLKDSTNTMLFEKQQVNYKQLSSKEKDKQKAASIRPVAITTDNDTTVLYKYYQTSNAADTTTLRIIRQKDSSWVVDLKSIINM
jgi:hypothetical protein